MPVPAAILANVSWICMASSRVGLKTMARMPGNAVLLGLRSRCDWRMGSTNASVLPVPVCAVATKSRPSSAGSMASSWMGVGWTKPCLDRLLFRRADKGKSEKLFMCNLRREKRQADYRSGERGIRINFQ